VTPPQPTVDELKQGGESARHLDEAEVYAVARRLTNAQRELLADLCRCPGLFAGQYTYDGAGIEHLPLELREHAYKGSVYVMLGLGHAYPSALGVAVNEAIEDGI
jgi:hypothetical protein